MTPDEAVARLLDTLDSPQESQAITAQLKTDDLMPTAEGLKRQVLFYLPKDAPKATQIADRILDMAAWQQAPLVEALGLQTKAIALTLLDREYETALTLFDQSNAIYTKHNDDLSIAIGQVARVWALACLQRIEEAFEAAEWAEQVLTQQQAHRTLAALSNNLAAIYIRNGQDAEALERVKKVEAAYKQLGKEGQRRLPLALINRAFVLRNLGRFEESLEANHAALRTAEMNKQTANIARAKENLGITYAVLGQFNQAHVQLQQARDIFLKGERYRDAILVELFISDVFLHLRRYEAVLEKCKQVRQTFQASGTQFEIAQALLNEATAWAGLREHTKAFQVLNEARQLFIDEKNDAWQMRTNLEEALLLLHQGRYEASRETAVNCLKPLQTLELSLLQARAHIIVAWAAVALGQTDQAQAATDQALNIAQEKELPLLNYQCHYLNGQIALALENPQVALIAYESAIQALEKLQGQIMAEFRAEFLADKEAVYASAVDLCLAAGNPGIALDFAERAKSRTLLFLLSHHLDLKIEAKSPEDQPLVSKLLQLRDKRDRLYRRWETGETPGSNIHQLTEPKRLESARKTARQDITDTEDQIRQLWHRLLARNATYSSTASLWQVHTQIEQAKIGPDTLLVEYFALADGLVAFLVSTNSITAYRLPITLEMLGRQRRRLKHNFNTLIQVPHLADKLIRKAKGILHRFYQLLIEPFASQLEAYQQLIIVPHGLLHYLPFHAFYNGNDYLLSSHQIRYLPGSSFISANRPRAGSNPTALVIGHNRWGDLPYVSAETQTVARCLDTVPHLNEAATRQFFQEQAPTAQIIHIAAHGDYRPDNPLFSGLHLEDGMLTTLDIFNLHLPASLVTLSACQTGRGVIGGGDELMGVMRAFLAAGAASLLLTLWRVEDEITARLMGDFYTFLQAAHPKTVALQQAQIRMIAQHQGQLASHPYYWAPFFLVGDVPHI